MGCFQLDKDFVWNKGYKFVGAILCINDLIE